MSDACHLRSPNMVNIRSGMEVCCAEELLDVDDACHQWDKKGRRRAGGTSQWNQTLCSRPNEHQGSDYYMKRQSACSKESSFTVSVYRKNVRRRIVVQLAIHFKWQKESMAWSWHGIPFTSSLWSYQGEREGYINIYIYRCGRGCESKKKAKEKRKIVQTNALEEILKRNIRLPTTLRLPSWTLRRNTCLQVQFRYQAFDNTASSCPVG